MGAEPGSFLSLGRRKRFACSHNGPLGLKNDCKRLDSKPLR
jgi:hypothetical protein